MSNKLYFTNTDMKNALSEIIRQITCDKYTPDVIIAPGRGGYVPGVMLSHYYNCPLETIKWQTRDGVIREYVQLQNINEKYHGSNILVIDDINDSGQTLTGISSYLTQDDAGVRYATIFNKSTSSFNNVSYFAKELTPDYNPWVVFPYELWWAM